MSPHGWGWNQLTLSTTATRLGYDNDWKLSINDKNDWRNVGWNDKNSFGALMKKCYWVSTEITFGPSYKVLLLCDSCHQNMMINMIGTVLAKAATCFRFLLKSGQNKNIDFVQIFDNGKTWPKLPILYCTVNDSFHLLEFFLILEFIYFWNSRCLPSNDAFELLEFWFFSGSGNLYCSSLPMIYFLE